MRGRWCLGAKTERFARVVVPVLLVVATVSVPGPAENPSAGSGAGQVKTGQGTQASPGWQVLAAVVESLENSGTKVGIAVISRSRDSLLYSYNSLTPMIPASSQKLFVTGAAWDQWDPALVRQMRARLGYPARKLARTYRVRKGRRWVRRTRVVTLDSMKVWAQEHDSATGLVGFDLLCRIHKWSDNTAANTLLDCLAKRSGQAPSEVIAGYLKRQGIEDAGIRMVDGCGLSSDNRATPLALAKVLHTQLRAPRSGAWVRSLARAGRDGTLRRYSLGLGERVVAKTGSIRGVYSLCGYLIGEDDTLSFALLLNECPSRTDAFDTFARLLHLIQGCGLTSTQDRCRTPAGQSTGRHARPARRRAAPRTAPGR